MNKSTLEDLKKELKRLELQFLNEGYNKLYLGDKHKIIEKMTSIKKVIELFDI